MVVFDVWRLYVIFVCLYKGHGLAWADGEVGEDVLEFIQSSNAHPVPTSHPGPSPDQEAVRQEDASEDTWGTCICSDLERLCFNPLLAIDIRAIEAG